MWEWKQTGELLKDDAHVAYGYSGKGTCKNCPEMQPVRNAGPIVRGVYTIEPPINTHTHGPYVMWLTPDPSNVMLDRDGFGIHGDSLVQPGTASDGCIILARHIREMIWESGDHKLIVTEGR